MREGGIFAGHKVGSSDGTESNSAIIGSEITYNSYRPGIGKHREILIGFYAAAHHLFPEDGIGVTKDIQLFGSDFTENSDCKTGTRERADD